MTTLTWDVASDWDAAQSEDGVVHESVANTDHDDAGLLKKGYRLATPDLSTDLKLLLPMQEDSGSTIYDFSGNNIDGTYTGATLDQTGLLGTSAPDFDGTDDYGEVSYDSAFHFGDEDFTISCWINADRWDNNSSDNHIAGIYNTGGARAYRLFNSNGSLDFVVSEDGGSGSTKTVSSGINPTGTWVFLAGVHDSVNDELKIWVDNQFEGTTSWANGISDTGADFTIGKGDNFDQYVDGRICMVRVDGAALTSSELQSLYDIVNTDGTLTTAAKTA